MFSSKSYALNPPVIQSFIYLTKRKKIVRKKDIIIHALFIANDKIKNTISAR